MALAIDVLQAFTELIFGQTFTHHHKILTELAEIFHQKLRHPNRTCHEMDLSGGLEST